MKITSAKFFSTQDLVIKLRQVSMLQDRNAFPYKDCNIQVSTIATQFLSPAQRYVLYDELEKVKSLRWAMLEQYKIDILRLTDTRILDGKPLANSNRQDGQQLGYVEFILDGSDDTITLLPPVVEASEEADKSKHKIINDGMHRCFLARQYHIIPAVVAIEWIPKLLPYYAHPLPGGWGDVQIVDKLGKNFIKKFHRFPNGVYQQYYRDFNSIFSNVGGPRGQKGKTDVVTS